jgi:predicted dehydrogenase
VIRLGLIGCGAHSETGHAIPLARYKAAHPDEIELAAVCDLQVERAREFRGKYGFLAAYRNVDEMFDTENLDACIAVVPPEAISELGIKLLKMGVPCVVEKPLGSSLAEVKALQNSAAETHTWNMVSVNRRFMPFLNRAIDWTKEAGSLRYVRCTLTRHSRAEPEFIWATAVHAVDTLRYIAGEALVFDPRILKTDAGTRKWYSIPSRLKNSSAPRLHQNNEIRLPGLRRGTKTGVSIGRRVHGQWQHASAARSLRGCRGVAAGSHRSNGSRQSRPDVRHRRALYRNERTAGRLLLD